MQEKPFDFQNEVIEGSRTIPVLADFWAPWCGPCRTLTPVLERLAEKSAGRWKLVKVNTEEHPEIARDYGIRSIPNVKLFVGGRIVDEFSGALPEYQIEQWLKTVLPSPLAGKVAGAAASVAAGDKVRAMALLEEVLGEEPDNTAAAAAMARLVLFSDPSRAGRLAETLEREPEHRDLCEAVRTLAPLMERPDSALPEGAHRDDYAEAIACLRREEFDCALERFIGVLREERRYDDDGSRKACIAIFRLLGEEHEVTLKHRRAFDRAF